MKSSWMFFLCGSRFGNNLANLEKLLERCAKVNLVLNWERCHFIVKEDIVLIHLVSARGIDVDKAKIEVIEKLHSPVTIRGIHSFLLLDVVRLLLPHILKQRLSKTF